MKNKFTYLIIITLIATAISCQNNESQKIDLEALKDTSRAYNDDSIQEKKASKDLSEDVSILFFDELEYAISQDKFNQKMAEGKFLPLEKKSPDGKNEVHLISLKKHAENLESMNLPSFDIQDLNGNNYNLDYLNGKVTVLSFWFTASDLNVYEMNLVNEVAQKYENNENLVWLAPALDKKDLLSRFLKNKNWVFNFVAGQEKLALSFGVLTYPTHLIINKKGKVEKAIIRSSNAKEEIEKTIKKLLHD